MKFNYKILEIIRLKKGYKSPKALADAIGWGDKGIYKNETGENKIPLERLQGLADFYEIDLSEFFDFDGEEPIFQKSGGVEMDSEKERWYMKQIDKLWNEKEKLEARLQAFEGMVIEDEKKHNG